MKVAVIGGGIAGLTATYELAKRGFTVELYEKDSALGGKSRSFLTEEGYPGEHGLRVFCWHYYNMLDTMKEIGLHNQFQNQNIYRFYKEYDSIVYPTHFSLANIFRLIKAKRDLTKIIPEEEVDEFLSKINNIGKMNATELAGLDQSTWYEYMGSQKKSENFRRYLLRTSRHLNAMDPITGSAFTVGRQIYECFKCLKRPFQKGFAMMLKAPTSISLFDPWIKKIKEHKNASLYCNKDISKIEYENETKKIVAVHCKDGTQIHADYFIFALPIEVISDLIPSIPNIQELNQSKEIYSGVQFFLKEGNALPQGMMAFYDSPWEILGVNQNKKLWSKFSLKPPVTNVLSVVIASWNSPGVLTGKTALECSIEEIKAEVLAQINLHRGISVSKENIHSSCIDPTLEFSGDGQKLLKSSYLYVPRANSYSKRPTATGEYLPKNGFLAGDYTKTQFNVPSMEGACESGRIAVNALLDRVNSNEKKCPILHT